MASTLPTNPYGTHTEYLALSTESLLHALDYAEGQGDAQEVQAVVDELVRRGLGHLVLD